MPAHAHARISLGGRRLGPACLVYLILTGSERGRGTPESNASELLESTLRYISHNIHAVEGELNYRVENDASWANCGEGRASFMNP